MLVVELTSFCEAQWRQLTCKSAACDVRACYSAHVHRTVRTHGAWARPAVQDVRIGGVWLERCSNLDFHGPYEQTYTNEELPFTQGRILTLDDTKEPYMATVQVDYRSAPSSDALVTYKSCLACSLYRMLS